MNHALRNRKLVLRAALGLWAASLLLVVPTRPAGAALIGQWTFNEGSGTSALDSSGNSNPGAINGGASYVSAPGGSALQLDGADDFVDMGTPALFNIQGASAALTLATWVRVENDSDFTSSAEPNIAGKAYFYGLTATIGSARGFAYAGGGGNSLTSRGGWSVLHDELFTAGVWHHIVMTFDQAAAGTNYYLYFDGAVADYRYLAPTAIPNNAAISFQVGRNDMSPSVLFKGLVDQVDLYNNALDAGQVSALFAAGPATSPVPEPSTVALMLSGVLGIAVWRRQPKAG